jgi:hypothetical protein
MSIAFQKAANWVENRIIAVMPDAMLTPVALRVKHGQWALRKANEFKYRMHAGVNSAVALGNVMDAQHSGMHKLQVEIVRDEFLRHVNELRESLELVNKERPASFWILRGASGISMHTASRLRVVDRHTAVQNKVIKSITEKIDNLAHNATASHEAEQERAELMQSAIGQYLPRRSVTNTFDRLRSMPTV